MICRECGKETSKLYVSMCQSCYKYFLKGGIVHKLPERGTICFDDEGKCICHICGRSYKRLGSHVKESHSMTIEEYKEKFGLCRRSRTTEQTYHNTMRKHAFENDMDKNLKIWGENTKIKKGENDKRKGKEIRLQERIRLQRKNRKVIV